MSREELEEKLGKVAALAVQELEKRTGLQLQGLSAAEISKRVKAWEKAQKASKK